MPGRSESRKQTRTAPRAKHWKTGSRQWCLPGPHCHPPVFAVTVTVPPGGGTDGAVYKPADERVPQAPGNWLRQARLQTGVTLAPFTVAVNACCAPAARVSPVGVMISGGGLMVTVADTVCVESACATAVTVTLLGLGRLAGAV